MAQGIANLRTAPAGAARVETRDVGLAGVVLLAQFHDIATDARQLAHQYGRSGELFDSLQK